MINEPSTEDMIFVIKRTVTEDEPMGTGQSIAKNQCDKTFFAAVFRSNRYICIFNFN